jgi:hypothetical protein
MTRSAVVLHTSLILLLNVVNAQIDWPTPDWTPQAESNGIETAALACSKLTRTNLIWVQFY